MLKYHIIESGYFMGDGGVMFGPVPKKYWSAKYKKKNKNRKIKKKVQKIKYSVFLEKKM